MKISLDQPTHLSHADNLAINELATVGFGFTDPADMLDDTLRHIKGADVVQRVHDNQEVVGFALYQSCLWRASN